MTLQEDEVLFTLKVTATQNGQLKDMIAFTDVGMKTESYKGEDLIEHKAAIMFEDSKEVMQEFVLYQNEPNPFNSITTIAFEMPTTAEVTFTVYDAAGKTLYQLVNTYSEGINYITLNREEISATGVLFYKLESGEHTGTKKMIIID